MKTIGEIKEEFSAAREADWDAICQMYETDLRSGVQKLVQQELMKSTFCRQPMRQCDRR